MKDKIIVSVLLIDLFLLGFITGAVVGRNQTYYEINKAFGIMFQQ